MMYKDSLTETEKVFTGLARLFENVVKHSL